MEFGGLKVLMISSDRNLFAPGSAVAERMKEYGALVEELHIVVLSDASHKLEAAQLDKNIWLYPTSSSIKYLRPRTAARLGKKIVLDRKFVRGKSLITTQDPFECGVAGVEIKKKWRLPLEVQLHTDPFSPYFSGFLNVLRKHIARDVLKHADRVRAVSQSLLDKIASEYRFNTAKASVLPIYIDAEKFENLRPTFDLHARFGWRFILLAVARLTEEKNLGQALRVLKKLLEFYPDTGLVVVGEGPERGSLERLARALGVSGNVAFVGWQEDMASYYKTANLFIQTSRFEGYGLALVEACLSGLPVVTTPVGIASELENGKDAIICPQDDDGYMWKAVYDLIENSAEREILSTRIKHVMEGKLMKRDIYLARLKKNWEQTASSVGA